MYDWASFDRTASRLPDVPGPSSGEAARQALGRVRKALTDFLPGMHLDAECLRAALVTPFTESNQESDRLFALGWLHWLASDPDAAEPLLAGAAARFAKDGEKEKLAETAYWLARVRVGLGRSDAVAGYETVLRTLGGSPQATAWYVDLLGRAGQEDRAEQVWKSVRGNKRVAARDEGPLLEARCLLRRGETVAAEKLLQEAMPHNGVVQTERLLLLVWALASKKQMEPALDLLHQAEAKLYPVAALRSWREAVEGRAKDERLFHDAHPSPTLTAFLRGQQERLAGRADDAAAAYREALADSLLRPFARYGLASLGQEDLAGLRANQPGMFLSVRCRARMVLERFRRREARPVELLDALQLAAAADYATPEVVHFRCLAEALRQRPATSEALRSLTLPRPGDEPAARRNALRAALEAAGRLPPAEAATLFLEWARRDDLARDPGLRRELGRQLLRLLLVEAESATLPVADLVAAAERLLNGDSLTSLTRSLVLREFAEKTSTPPTDTHEAARLWHAATALARATPVVSAAIEDWQRWRENVASVRNQPRLQGLAQALFVLEAARRGDATEIAALLGDGDAWRGFHSGPPGFVLAALTSAVAAQPTHPAWRQSLGRWLQGWNATPLAPEALRLAELAGLTRPQPESVQPPPGQTPAPWFLHQAARAIGRDDYGSAFVFVRRAFDADTDLASVPDSTAVRETLTDLERLVRAADLAALICPEGEPPSNPGLLADFVTLLETVPEGSALFTAARRGNRADVWEILNGLADCPDVPPALTHHLAVLHLRCACAHEERAGTEAAEPFWRWAWTCWLRALGDNPEMATSPLFDWLFATHRRLLNDALARDDVPRARRHWSLVQEVPARAAKVNEPLARALLDRVARFRDELATDFLLTTREAMRYGVIPEGWRADYDKGLGYLRRLLSLDRDNVRLLTALVEICTEWFLDLYNASDRGGLAERVERYTPFALQLARVVSERTGEPAARVALAEFYKFRGFIATDRERKRSLYREALRFDPANENVRGLLAELEPMPPTEE